MSHYLHFAPFITFISITKFGADLMFTAFHADSSCCLAITCLQFLLMVYVSFVFFENEAEIHSRNCEIFGFQCFC